MDGHQRSPAVTVAQIEAHGGTIARVTELGLRSARCDGEQQKMMQQG
jgi:hypothetical protein